MAHRVAKRRRLVVEKELTHLNTQTENCLGVDSFMEEAMHLFDQKILGIVILFLLCMLVVVKQRATGAILDRPQGTFPVQLVNSFNLFSLLVVNPVAAILLMTRRVEMIDPTRIIISEPRLLMVLEMAGLVIYVLGYLFMAWALTSLGYNYQIGGSAPRPKDAIVMNGPYRLVRHPMYSAAMVISLGLAGMTQSGILFGVFGLYLMLILSLIPLEEEGLRQVYDQQYIHYQLKTKKLIPFVY
jgi:protein-S-isoprenylcysteine O-methyltransferase Ste14